MICYLLNTYHVDAGMLSFNTCKLPSSLHPASLVHRDFSVRSGGSDVVDCRTALPALKSGCSDTLEHARRPLARLLGSQEWYKYTNHFWICFWFPNALYSESLRGKTSPQNATWIQVSIISSLIPMGRFLSFAKVSSYSGNFPDSFPGIHIHGPLFPTPGGTVLGRLWSDQGWGYEGDIFMKAFENKYISIPNYYNTYMYTIHIWLHIIFI